MAGQTLGFEFGDEAKLDASIQYRIFPRELEIVGKKQVLRHAKLRAYGCISKCRCLS